jgi:signal transduction histidine kinase
MKYKLSTQLSLSILLVAMIIVGMVSVFANFNINRQFEEYIAGQERRRSENIVADISDNYNAMTQTWSKDYLHTIGMFSLYDGYILKVNDSYGNVVWDSENHDQTLCGQIMFDIIARMENVKATGSFDTHLYDLTQGSQTIGSVAVAYYGPYFYSESDFRFINALNSVLVIIGALSFIVSIAAGLILARRIALPIAKTAELAKRISRGDYDIRFEGEPNTTELADLVSAINHLASALSEQEALRKQLTADVAHELRTPLTSIASYLEAMLDGIWETSPQRIQSCYEEVTRLSVLVNDLGRIADADGGTEKLNKAPVDLLAIVQSICSAWEAEVNKKELTLTVSGEPVTINANKDRISQVVINLLSNAVNYTSEHGCIDITVNEQDRSAVLTVQDNGIGIAENELPYIFERFYRTDKSRNRKSGGAGIGLAIVKSIVNAHGGTVTAESVNGAGTVVTVTLPKL